MTEDLIAEKIEFKERIKRLKEKSRVLRKETLEKTKPLEQDGDDKEWKEKVIREEWEDKCDTHRFNLASIERFFHSQWYQMLTDADGDAIFQKLKQEADKI